MDEDLPAVRAELGEVPPRLSEAQVGVGAPVDLVGVVIVLPVVLPETDRTDLVPASLMESEEPAARTRIRLVSSRASDHIFPLRSHRGVSAPRLSQAASIRTVLTPMVSRTRPADDP